jgi:hypothetical protein
VLAKEFLVSEGRAFSRRSATGGWGAAADRKRGMEGLAAFSCSFELLPRAAQSKGSTAAQEVDSMGGADELGVAAGIGLCRADWLCGYCCDPYTGSHRTHLDSRAEAEL